MKAIRLLLLSLYACAALSLGYGCLVFMDKAASNFVAAYKR